MSKYIIKGRMSFDEIIEMGEKRREIKRDYEKNRMNYILSTTLEERKKNDLFSRFWNMVDKKENDKCWLWKGHLNWCGYGRIFYKQKFIYAHRMSWLLHFSDNLNEDVNVLHKCDNPSCVNPNHLFLGTYKDNMHDKIIKGRQSRKLTEKDIKDIIEEYNNHKSIYELYKKYGVTSRHIRRIVYEGWRPVNYVS